MSTYICANVSHSRGTARRAISYPTIHEALLRRTGTALIYELTGDAIYRIKPATALREFCMWCAHRVVGYWDAPVEFDKCITRWLQCGFRAASGPANSALHDDYEGAHGSYQAAVSVMRDWFEDTAAEVRRVLDLYTTTNAPASKIHAARCSLNALEAMLTSRSTTALVADYAANCTSAMLAIFPDAGAEALEVELRRLLRLWGIQEEVMDAAYVAPPKALNIDADLHRVRIELQSAAPTTQVTLTQSYTDTCDLVSRLILILRHATPAAAKDRQAIVDLISSLAH